MDYPPILIAVIITAIIFDFVNGWHDAANAIATVVGTRVLSPLKALLLAACLNLAGAFLGEEVAKTVGGGLVQTDLISLTVLLAAMGSAIVWEAYTLVIGMPVSASHALIGGLIGAAVAKAGITVVVAKGVLKTLALMLMSPIVGFIGAFVIYMVIAYFFRNRAPGPSGRLFGKLQILSASSMALSHGTNDAQKAMGIITLALVLSDKWPSMDQGIPPWVVFSCGLAIALGTASGGWKVIKTLGHGLSRLKPVDGFCAETSASLMLFVTAALGIPVSTTHTITGAILGVGSTKGKHSVRWGLGNKIVLAWILTFPATIALGGGIYWVLWAGFGLDNEPHPPWKATVQVVDGSHVKISWPEMPRAESYKVVRYDRIDKVKEDAAKGQKSIELRNPSSERVVREASKENSVIDEDTKLGGRYVYLIKSRNAYGESRISEEFAVDVEPPKSPKADGTAPATP
ncbi:MAG: inorganic phosphate transporter [Planctomycetes bacterium]|nr:inorganic phosphate transporter [Planctomycetota bacterium]